MEKMIEEEERLCPLLAGHRRRLTDRSDNMLLCCIIVAFLRSRRKEMTPISLAIAALGSKIMGGQHLVPILPVCAPVFFL